MAENYLPYMYGIQALSGAFSAYQQGKARKYISKSNEMTARLQAEDARRRGNEYEAISRQKTKKALGSQKASYAGQNVSVSDGSPLDVYTETANIGELDALTIKNNAARAAFGYEIDALSSSMEGRLSYQVGVNSALDTLLTGGLRAYDAYKRYGK